MDDADPSLEQRILDIVQQSWIGIEPLNLDSLKLKSLAFLPSQLEILPYSMDDGLGGLMDD